MCHDVIKRSLSERKNISFPLDYLIKIAEMEENRGACLRGNVCASQQGAPGLIVGATNNYLCWLG